MAESIQKILILVNLLFVAALIVMAAGKADIVHARLMFPKGLRGIGAAISIIYVFFLMKRIKNAPEDSILRQRAEGKQFTKMPDKPLVKRSVAPQES